MGNESEDHKPPVHLYEFGLYRLDTLDKTELRLLYKGRPLILPEKQFSLLCVLVRNHGHDLSCDELIKEVWPDTYVEPDDNSLKAPERREANQQKLQKQVSLLRKSIGRAGVNNTENNKGYTFGLPVEEIPPPPDWEEVYEDLKFNKWIFLPQKGKPITFALSAGIALSVVYLLCYTLFAAAASGSYSGFMPKVLSQPVVALSLIQAVVIAGAAAFSPLIFDRGGKDFRDSGSILETSVMRACGYDDPEQWETAKGRAKAALKQYVKYWKLLLGVWLVLYLLFFFTAYNAPSAGAALSEKQLTLYRWLNIASTLLNNCNTLALVLCYVTLNYPTVVKEEGRHMGNTHLTKVIIIVGGSAILFFTVIECMEVFRAWMFGPDKEAIRLGMEMGSGIFGGTALALYVGRVRSKFLDPPDWLAPALYLYAVIQPLYPFIQNNTGGAFIIEAALILKSLLYLYMAWLFKSGRLLFYMVRVRSIYESVNTQWKDFLWNLDKDDAHA